MKEFLFEYGFRGETWGITIHANDLMEAREKIKAVTFAQYKGEVAAVIPVVPRVPIAMYAVAAIALVGAIYYALH